VPDEREVGCYQGFFGSISGTKQRPDDIPTPRVPTRIPKTSESRAFWTTAYRRMRSLFVREDSRRAVSVWES